METTNHNNHSKKQQKPAKYPKSTTEKGFSGTPD